MMDNPEKRQHWVQDTDKTTQNTKKKSNTDPTKKLGCTHVFGQGKRLGFCSQRDITLWCCGCLHFYSKITFNSYCLLSITISHSQLICICILHSISVSITLTVSILLLLLVKFYFIVNLYRIALCLDTLCLETGLCNSSHSCLECGRLFVRSPVRLGKIIYLLLLW